MTSMTNRSLQLVAIVCVQILILLQLPSTESRKKIHIGGGKGRDMSFEVINTEDEDWNRTEQEQANQFIDFLFNSVASMVVVEQIQPLRVPDSKRKFSKRFFGIHVTGELKIFNGSITDGLETLHRFGDATLDTAKNATHGSVLFSFGFGMKNVHFRSRFGVRLLKHGPDGDVLAMCPKIRMVAEFMVNFQRPPDDPAAMAAMAEAMATQPLSQIMTLDVELRKVKVLEMDRPILKIHAIHLGPFIKIATSALVRLFKKSINRKVEKAVEKHIAAVLLRILASPIMKPIVQMAMKLIM